METEWIRQAAAGDTAAYEKLMQQYHRTIEKFSYQCGVHLHDIPDVTQEVFIKLYRFLPQFNYERFTTWLYKITLNTARDYYRKEGRERAKEERLKAPGGRSAADSAESQVLLFEEDRQLHEAIQRLDEKYRIPVILFYFQDLTYDQIAEVMNITMAAVKTRLYRAKDKLKDELQMTGGNVNERR